MYAIGYLHLMKEPAAFKVAGSFIFSVYGIH